MLPHSESDLFDYLRQVFDDYFLDGGELDRLMEDEKFAGNKISSILREIEQTCSDWLWEEYERQQKYYDQEKAS